MRPLPVCQLFFMLLPACDASSCNGGGGLDFDNDIDPIAGAPSTLLSMAGGDGKTAVWSVRWDNPPVQSTATLGATHAAVRSDSTWDYSRFDLTLDDGALGLLPWPSAQGTWDKDNPQMPWEAHGLALAPRLTGAPGEGIATLQAYLQDANSGTPLPHLGTGRFQLASDVLIVPLNVVVTYPTSGPVATFPQGWLPERTVRALFDDAWLADKTILNNPNEHPHSVTAHWSTASNCLDPNSTVCQVGQVALPDRVWDQCNIQFRLVSYVNSCPVPADAFDNLSLGGDCSGSAQVTKINNAVKNCILNNGADNVVIVGSLNDKSYCPPLYGLSKKTGTMYLGAAFANFPFVLAHELGHKLNLPDIGDDKTCGGTSLMCQAVEPQTAVLQGCAGVAPNCGACDQARTWAAYHQGQYPW